MLDCAHARRAGSWLAQRADGKWFVIVVTANAPAAAVDNAAASVAQGVFDLLAKP